MKPKQTIEYKRSVLYPRVSSQRQVQEGHGLDSQSLRCEKFSVEQGLEVAARFPDEGISGALFERPGFRALLNFLDENAYEKFVVIIDDVSRLARDLKVYLQLKKELSIRGAKIMSPNFQFEDTPEGEFIENIIAAKAQLDRSQNTRQVKQKMKARLDAGYWTFCPPPGLVNKKHPIKGKVLSPDEPYAAIYKEAIEKFKNFELNTLEVVRQFILSKYADNDIKKPLSLSAVSRILSELLYSGYLEYEKWGVERFKAQHEGFISYETYLAVQKKLASKAKPRLRKDYNKDFPLRGFILCNECSKPMTAAWFSGNGGKYAYYKCKQDGCLHKNKTFSKEDVESKFTGLLNKIEPKPEVLSFLEAVLKDTWESRRENEQNDKNNTSNAIRDLENKNKMLMERLTHTQKPSMISEYEKAITQHLNEIQVLNINLVKTKYPNEEFQTALGVVLNFIESPVKQWESRDYKRQRLLLGMYFDQKLAYHPVLGFQTVELPLILKLSQTKMTPKGHLVEMMGVKPMSKTHSSFTSSQD